MPLFRWPDMEASSHFGMSQIIAAAETADEARALIEDRIFKFLDARYPGLDGFERTARAANIISDIQSQPETGSVLFQEIVRADADAQ